MSGAFALLTTAKALGESWMTVTVKSNDANDKRKWIVMAMFGLAACVR